MEREVGKKADNDLGDYSEQSLKLDLCDKTTYK